MSQVTEYDPSATYLANDRVTLDGKTFVALHFTSGVAPDSHQGRRGTGVNAKGTDEQHDDATWREVK